ncbi:hypothetical protein UlMin_015594 [Ulmus minor]
MEPETSILGFLENKTILVTGSTGFLAKTFMEKILRVQPNVKKFYLLLRASDSESARQRLQTEVVGKEVFRVLKGKWGKDFESLISKKLIPVQGDVAYENLGIKDSSLREEMWNDIDIIVNSAATTDFYERYDISLAINTAGALNIMNFAQKCIKLKMFLHVSTAYVCGESKGLILEKPFGIGETLKETHSKLDYEFEKQLAEEKLNKLRAEGITESTITSIMKDFGMERAKLFGWPNTYVFTKAMGEMCLSAAQSKHNIPIVILRPTMITSTYKEPFPGWIEGLRTIDSVIVGYGKGKLTCFLADPTMQIDMIPADMVVNAMIVSMVNHANQYNSGMNIYHVGSSLRNPINFSMIHGYSYRCFTEKPLANKDGTPIKVVKGLVLPNVATFRVFLAIRFVLPLKILQLVNIIFFRRIFQDVYVNSVRKLKLVLHLVEIYKPYLLFKGIFDDINSERLHQKATESYKEMEAFNFDPKCIDWEKYIMNAHIPGLKKYVIRK